MIAEDTSHKAIMLVEDNTDDVELTRLAFAEVRIGNPLVVARDGVEALDYLFGRGIHAGRDTRDLPALVQQLRDQHRAIEWSLHTPIGEHPDVIEAMAAATLNGID